MQIKHTILAASAALVIGGAAIGIAAAQSAPGSGAKGFVEVLAAKLGLPTDRVQTAIKETQAEVGPMRGPGGFGGFGGPGRPGLGGVPGVRVAVAENHKIIADAIGITEDALRTELRAGKSIADVAKAHNVDPKKVIDTLVADANTRIDAAVTSGRVTADQAAKLKEGVAKMVENAVNQVRPVGPAVGGPRRGLPGLPGMPGLGRPGVVLMLPGLDAAAKSIGIPVEQLRTELPGKSLTDVAKAHGVDPNSVAAALKSAAQEQNAKRVDDLMQRQFPAAGAAPTLRTERGGNAPRPNAA